MCLTNNVPIECGAQRRVSGALQARLNFAAVARDKAPCRIVSDITGVSPSLLIARPQPRTRVCARAWRWRGRHCGGCRSRPTRRGENESTQSPTKPSAYAGGACPGVRGGFALAGDPARRAGWHCRRNIRRASQSTGEVRTFPFRRCDRTGGVRAVLLQGDATRASSQASAPQRQAITL